MGQFETMEAIAQSGTNEPVPSTPGIQGRTPKFDFVLLFKKIPLDISKQLAEYKIGPGM